MTVVLDTTVIVAALVAKGLCHKVVVRALGACTVVTSTPLLRFAAPAHVLAWGMAKPSARDRAVARMRELLGELKLLTATFPDIHDSFDEDELPIAFIIRRDAARASQRAARAAAPVRRSSGTALVKPKRGPIKT